MLVLSRELGQSLIVFGTFDACLITILQVSSEAAKLLICHSPRNVDFDAWTFDISVDGKAKVGTTVEVSLVDLRGQKARLGIVTPHGYSVHRLEVWEAIKAKRDDPEGEGSAGITTPPPSGPLPPPLDVRMKPPAPEAG